MKDGQTEKPVDMFFRKINEAASNGGHPYLLVDMNEIDSEIKDVIEEALEHVVEVAKNEERLRILGVVKTLGDKHGKV